MERVASQDRFAEDGEEVARVVANLHGDFEGRPDELIPMLQKAQKALNYLPEEVLLAIARRLKLPAAKVFGVVTFYEQFRLHPVGKHIVKVCRGTACHVKGSDRILNDIQSRFHVGPGETSRDRKFTLETVACFGSCALAPVMVVDDSVKGRIDPPRARKILEGIEEEADTF
ncbi:MAG: NAD(P)H-dependent oxidoreductase subunit E [Pseudomonadota bacterium]